MLNDLGRWSHDGQGTVHSLADGGWRVQMESPFALWCPSPLNGDIELSFSCTLHTLDSAMVVLACARAWRGDPHVPRRCRNGEYKDYAYGDLEMYSVGFNRTGHVSNARQPNASSLNVRRIGGPEHVRFAALTLENQSEATRVQWRQWDRATLLCSVAEPFSGVGKSLHYHMRFFQGCIAVTLEGQPLVTVQDHHPRPLSGGYVAIRNMTRGACFDVRDATLTPVPPGDARG